MLERATVAGAHLDHVAAEAYEDAPPNLLRDQVGAPLLSPLEGSARTAIAAARRGSTRSQEHPTNADWRETYAVELPETHYATSGGVSIAYQVLGDGPFDIVYVPGFVSHLELRWRVPSLSASLGELAEFSRLILFDKRGTGDIGPRRRRADAGDADG